jgi:hypothetical protein
VGIQGLDEFRGSCHDVRMGNISIKDTGENMLWDALMLLSIELILVYVLVISIGTAVRTLMQKSSKEILAKILQLNAPDYQRLRSQWKPPMTDRNFTLEQALFFDRPTMGAFMAVVLAFVLILVGMNLFQHQRFGNYSSPSGFGYIKQTAIMLTFYLITLCGIQIVALYLVFGKMTNMVYRNIYLSSMGAITFQEDPQVLREKKCSSTLQNVLLIVIVSFFLISTLCICIFSARFFKSDTYVADKPSATGRLVFDVVFHMVGLVSPVLCIITLGSLLPSFGFYIYYIQYVFSSPMFAADIFFRWKQGQSLEFLTTMPGYQPLYDRLQDPLLSEEGAIVLVTESLNMAWKNHQFAQPIEDTWVRLEYPPIESHLKTIWLPVLLLGGIVFLISTWILLQRSFHTDTFTSPPQRWSYFALRITYLLSIFAIYVTFSMTIDHHPEYCKKLLAMKPVLGKAPKWLIGIEDMASQSSSVKTSIASMSYLDEASLYSSVKTSNIANMSYLDEASLMADIEQDRIPVPSFVAPNVTPSVFQAMTPQRSPLAAPAPSPASSGTTTPTSWKSATAILQGWFS